MAIRVVSYEGAHVEAVRAFNRRIRQAGATSVEIGETPPGEDLPAARACGIAFQHFLALDDSNEVRGGYFIRTQPFWIHDQIKLVGHFTAPVSEGLIDKRYAAVGTRLLSHASKLQPLLFAMGMGSVTNPLPRMLRAMQWTILEVPFFFRVLNGSAFLRNLGPLHTSKPRSFLANTLAATGIGPIGLSMLQRLRTRARFDGSLTPVPVLSFEPWADDLWRATCHQYSFSAVRDSKYLNFLYPAEQLPPICLEKSGRMQAWTQLMHCTPRNASFFRGMRVMALVDGDAMPSAVPSLILGAIEQARREGADLLFSNQMHRDWTKALRSCGFLQGPSNYLLALSPGLTKLLDPLAESASRIHFNRGDGDGRVNLRD